MVGEVLNDGEGGHGVDLLLAHDLHRCRREVVSVVDAGYTGFGCVGCARFAGAMYADEGAGAVGFGDGGGELLFSELIGRGEGAAVEMVAAGFVELGEVGALFALFAHDGDDLVGGVGIVGVGEHVLRGIEADGVFMTAEDVDGVAGDAHAGAGNEASIDGVAHGDVCTPGALGAHVAFGGEAGHYVGLGGCGGQEGALRNGLFYGLEAFVAGVKE